MTSHELARKLLELEDLKVVTYNRDAEEFGDINSITIISSAEKLPYSKTGQNTLPDGNIILLAGFTYQN